MDHNAHIDDELALLMERFRSAADAGDEEAMDAIQTKIDELRNESP